MQEHLSSRPNLNLESEVTSDNKERLRKIISTVQNDAPESRMGNMGFILDFIVNFDKYQRMLTLLNTLMKNQNLGQDRDKLLKMVEPIMEKESPSGEASLDIEKIIQIISLLNKTKDGKKEPEGEDRQVKPEANSKKPDKDMPKKESSYEEKDKEGMEKEEGDKKELAKEKMVKKERPENLVFQYTYQLLHILGKGGIEFNFPFFSRMLGLQIIGMQGLPLYIGAFLIVQAVAYYGMTHVLHMDPNLVGATCKDSYF